MDGGQELRPEMGRVGGRSSSSDMINDGSHTEKDCLAKVHFVWITVGYVLYSLHVCVCVGALDTTTASDDPFTQSSVVCTGRFLRGVPGGGKYAPLVTRSVRGSAPIFFFWAFFCYF
jgi:hypothetical protein